jgi:3-hydroxyisobutyrate dehydrogenase-like beta-hydroxyacid dehydrogenase
MADFMEGLAGCSNRLARRSSCHLHVWARRPNSLEALGTVAHIRHDTTSDLAASCDIVALCVSTDEDVMQIVTGGLLDGMRPGSVLVNHGTGTPRNAVRLTETCAHAGVDVLDAPVSGGRPAAQERTLTTMVGGPQPVVQRCEALFGSFSRHVLYLGGPGSGQTVKLLNNALLIMNQANIADIVLCSVSSLQRCQFYPQSSSATIRSPGRILSKYAP